jgi:sodium transport system ATP-binding protein
MIIAENLTKIFEDTGRGEVVAVQGLSFQIRPGEIYGLLGPNGAGKTTTLRMLATLLQPTSGRVSICGYDGREDGVEVRRRIGFLTATSGLYHRLTPEETLRYFGRLHGLGGEELERRIEEVIALLDMADFRHSLCRKLSTGQRQRTAVARVLIHDPPVLILDEPTAGLDVLSNRLILRFLRESRDRGKAVLFSTHYLEEAQSLCDRFGLLHRGALLAEGTLEDLRRVAPHEHLTDIFLALVQEGGREEMVHG